MDEQEKMNPAEVQMDTIEQAVEEAPVENPETEGLEPGNNKKKKAKKSVGQEILSWVITIVAAVAIAMAIRTFIFEPVRVDGQSMCDTLQNGEIMIVTKPEYIFGAPQVGDVVICHYPNRTSKGLLGIETKTKFVKRIVGIPGDTIKIVDHKVFRKAAGTDEFVQVPDDYLTAERNQSSRTANMNEVQLADNEYFVMGDNRDNSNDSRYIGPITRDMILGHVQLVVFPFNVIRGIH